MQNQDKFRWLGIGLILFGVFALVVQFELIYLSPEMIVAAVLGFSGAALCVSYLRGHKLWRLFVGAPLFFAGVSIYISTSPSIPDEFIGTLCLWSIAVAFLLLYLRRRDQWWALIPGGVLLTLGTIVTIEAFHWLPDELMGSVLFLGFGLTFLALYALKPGETRLAWAVWPALGCFGMAAFIWLDLLFYIDFGELVFPILLIVLGLLAIVRSWRQTQRLSKNNNHAGA